MLFVLPYSLYVKFTDFVGSFEFSAISHFKIFRLAYLTVECSPVLYILRAWFAGWHYWELLKPFKRWSLVRGLWVTEACLWKLSSFLLPGDEVNNLSCHMLPLWCTALPQAQSGTNQSDTRASKAVNQNQPFLSDREIG